jgi:hypothetical protein
VQLPEDGRQPAEPIGDELLEVDGLAVGVEGAGFDPAQGEQVVDEAVEAVDLVAHHGEQLGARLVVVGDPVAQIRGHGSDRRQRRAQVVGHGAQERAALVVDPSEVVGAHRSCA